MLIQSIRGETERLELGLLVVIRVTMEMDTVFLQNVAKGEEVYDEKKGPKDKALGYTCCDGEG